MEEKRRKELVRQEVNKVHGLGEAEGPEHMSSSGIHAIYIGEEKINNGKTSFPFSAEVVRLSEFGERRFWYFGTITMKLDGTVEPEMHVHEGSGMNTFIAFISPEQEKSIEKRIREIRKELHLESEG